MTYFGREKIEWGRENGRIRHREAPSARQPTTYKRPNRGDLWGPNLGCARLVGTAVWFEC